MMEAKRTFSLTWCEKHKYWWVTNCPDCMVDDNEEDIKRAGIREVVEWLETKGHQEIDEGSGDWYWEFDFCMRYHEWQAKLKEWGIEQ